MVKKAKKARSVKPRAQPDSAEPVAAAEPTIAAAVGGATGGGNQVDSAEIEKAMAEAGLKAMEEGITDPDEIRNRKLAARDAVINKAV